MALSPWHKLDVLLIVSSPLRGGGNECERPSKVRRRCFLTADLRGCRAQFPPHFLYAPQVRATQPAPQVPAATESSTCAGCRVMEPDGAEARKRLWGGKPPQPPPGLPGNGDSIAPLMHTGPALPPRRASGGGPAAPAPAVSALRKRHSELELGEHFAGGSMPDEPTAKRQKAETAAGTTGPSVIEIKDSDDEEDDSLVSDMEEWDALLNAAQLPPPGTHAALSRPTTGTSPPVDHLGRPLSEATLAVAREYWDCQRKLDSCPLDEQRAPGTALPIDLLLQLAWHRRAYTKLVLGVDKLEPGTRTYEPPHCGDLCIAKRSAG
ncbi:uncharacterized protein THITE_113492 [Thermothielavioides terrestris NRRL 8126]|uniref:Uncharacterized protein n=1 Tax=Thermothielavioides terrestris (strain ATCC 38088 / NRRL 8126) TaxID=578455 RepID=G2R9S2_THETT|nr:uncharacterized protein THITE_113492 [Thermothielavioides terrestris NRRL 8126]AEO68760.1 hypothetical protein THITE_113492 [Thermothielavioides terrestris NRRL 8126]